LSPACHILGDMMQKARLPGVGNLVSETGIA
jgi:hypothetical protein